MADPKRDAGVTVNDVLQTAKVVKDTFSRNSLTRMAKDSIFQFPMIISANIPTEDAITIAKAFEVYYASLMVSVISLRSDYRRDEYGTSADYLKVFHQNSDLPNIFASAAGSAQYESIIATTIPGYGDLIPKDVIMECWNTPSNTYNVERLNAIYTPTTEAQRALEAYAEQIRTMHLPAMEAGIKGRGDIGMPKGNKTVKTHVVKNVLQFEDDGVTPKTYKDEKGKTRYVTGDNVDSETSYSDARMTGSQAIERNQTLMGLEPTLINLQLTSSKGDGATIQHNIVVGIKAMINSVNTNYMMANLIDGCNSNRGVFSKFIEWSEGTKAFVKNLILGIDSAKENAQADKYAMKWIRTLKRRKNSNLLSKIGITGQVLPNTTIGCTEKEVLEVASACGCDLSEAYNALKFISEYYLLGFFIYKDNGSIDVIFDGDTKFSTTSVRNMKAKTDKGMDVNSFLEVMKIMGR